MNINDNLKLYNNCIRYYDLDTLEKKYDFFTSPPFCYNIDYDNERYLINYHNPSDLYEDDVEPSGMAIPMTSIMRGAIFERKTNRPLVLPLPQFSNPDNFDCYDFKDLEFTELIDGTLVYLHFYDNMWRISTRGRLNAFHSHWRSEGSFGDLAAELFIGYDFNMLDKRCCYGLVIEHPENYNVIIPTSKNLYHIFTRNMDTLEEVDVNIGITKPRRHIFMSAKFLEIYLKNCKLVRSIGVIARDRNTNRRCTYYTKAYKRMKGLIKNHINIRNIFVDSYTGIGDSIKNVRHILSHFKGWNSEWKWVLHNYTALIDEIEYYYELCYKKRKHTVLPYYLKPVLYKIHGIYINRKRKWYQIESLRRLTEPYYKGDIESNPSPKIIRYDIKEWYAELPFDEKRELLFHFSKMNSV